MKFFPFLIFSIFLSSIAAFSAQGEFATPYSIGSGDNPVTVKEYVCFLNTNREAREDGSWKVLWCEYYHDQYLMESSEAVIQRSGKKGSYHYSVREGCDDQLITSLEGYAASNHFNQWRKYPLITEYLRYTNDQIVLKQQHSEIASEAQQLAMEESLEIKARYPNNHRIEGVFRQLNEAVRRFLKNPSHNRAIFEENLSYMSDGWGDCIFIRDRGKVLFTIEDTPQGYVALLDDNIDENEHCSQEVFLEDR